MSRKKVVRAYARKWQRKVARLMLRLALRLATPDGFVGDDSLGGQAKRDYLAQLGGGKVRDGEPRDALLLQGADRILDNLYDLAGENATLRDHLIRDAADRMFHGLYGPALGDAPSCAYLIERGIEDLHNHVERIAKDLGSPFAQRTVGYGQEGEDLILRRLFQGQDAGLYVDVGAHHPFRFSNTYLLHQRGWRGINIDAMPGSMDAFRRWRPQDTNIECMISSQPSSYTYYQYDEPALNTVSEAVVEKRKVESPQYQVIGTVVLQSRPLAGLLAEHISSGTVIDLMNVDVEGLDLDVLASNDWDRFRPRVIVVELLWTGFSDMEDSEMYSFLAARGYRLLSKLMNSAIFTL